MTSDPNSISPGQVRAARALLGWSQRDLASHAKIAVSTVADFERGQRTPVPNNAMAVCQALEAAGVHLAAGGAVIGSLPSPAMSSIKGQPIRWIDASDIVQWGERRDGQDAASELLSRLIRAETGHTAMLRFPSGESVMFSGWDGTCKVASTSPYLPDGHSGWEIGTQRNAIAAKASSDLAKRTASTSSIERAETCFVFVTTRRWAGKDEWASQQRAKGQWRSVRVLDADDLVHWIELHPAIGYWLAVRIGKRPSGLLQLDEAWEEWSRSTRPPMSADLVLAGRDEEAAGLLRWLRKAPAVLSVQAESPEEAVAFMYAAISQLPPEHSAPYHARALVVSSLEAARMLSDGPSPLIIVLTSGDAGLSEKLVARGHHVFAAFGSEIGVPEGSVRLPRPRRSSIHPALLGMGVPEADAERIARDCGRSLAILRRLMPAAPGRTAPVWSQLPVARKIAPAVLVGAWMETNAADRAALAKLAGVDYTTAAEAFVPWATALESPLRRVGDAWKVASPRDAWFRIAPFVTATDVGVFADIAFECLTREPAGEDRTFADLLSGKAPKEARASHLLRTGITETIAILAVHGKHTSLVPNLESRMEELVRRLLDAADGSRWKTLAGSLRALAEASPDAFLNALEDALRRPKPAAIALFEEYGAGYSELLWALRTLAWSPDYFARTVQALASLARLDPGGRNSDRPEEALRGLFLLWNPQTTATLDQRLRVLKRLRKQEPQSAWSLMLGLMPRGHDTVVPSPKPRWRDIPTEVTETVTYGLIGRGAATITDWLLEDVGASTERWLNIIEILPNIEAAKRENALEVLERILPELNNPAERTQLRAKIRHLLHHHRQFPDADWSLSKDELNPIDAIYEQLSLGDVANDTEWLFATYHPDLPDPSPGHDLDADGARATALRREAVERIHGTAGADGVLSLIRPSVQISLVGRAVSEAALTVLEKHRLAARALLEIGDCGAEFVHGLLAADGEEADQLIKSLYDSAREDGWPPSAVVLLLLAIGPRVATWALARSSGAEVEAAYWTRVSPFIVPDNAADEQAYAVRHLLDADRPQDALAIIGRMPAKFARELLMETLLAAASSPPRENAHSNDRVMLNWYVQQVLEHLDMAGVPDEQIARIELAYLPMLNFARHYPNGRPPRAIYKLLAEHPQEFAEIVCILYRPSEESGIVEDRDLSDPEVKARAANAWDLLHHFDHVPGTQVLGGIDGQKLEAWVAAARRLCVQAGRSEVGDQKIGEMLARAPYDEDGAWPHSAVRDVIEISRSRDLELGVHIGRRNMRGVTVRGPEDGGAQERDLAAQYRAWSRATTFEWPRTSALLERLAQDFEADGRWQDDRRESEDWGY